jgi:hypothetical protein
LEVDRVCRQGSRRGSPADRWCEDNVPSLEGVLK